MSTFEQITRKITKFAYDEVPQLFEYLKINAADWPYEEAQSEFDALLEKMLRLNQKHNTPSFTVVCGIPCSGKTRVSDALYSERKEVVLIQFDAIMESLSYYKKLCGEAGYKVAFEKCELVAQVVGYQLLKLAIEGGSQVLFEHSSAVKEHLDLYRLITEEYKYRVKMIYVEVSLQTALNRNKKGRKNNRYTPNEFIENRYRILQELLPKYKEIVAVETVAGA